MTKLFQAFLLAAALCTVSAGETWLTDLEAAKKEAAKGNKAILMDFTGSDWCGFCIKLKKEVFDTEEFKKFAEKNLVLVEVDFPNKKPQPEALKAANEELQKKYGVQGFPTVVILDSTGKKLDQFVGYGGGGPKKYIENLQKVLAKKATS
jgi:protein disulfide-isomerase